MNIWFWLFFIIPPLLVFSAKPESSFRWQASRLLLAIIAGWMSMCFALDWLWQADYKMLQLFWHKFPNCIDHQCANEPKTIDRGIFTGIVAYFGWIPMLSFVGIYETVWRIFFYRRMKKLKISFHDNLFSNIFIVLAVLCSYPAYILIPDWIRHFF